ncbi:MAG: methyltransferase domain-containing protein [SAR202 cluster bacterium]|nr:methyltransferase domain-containing protein [SAR202 cluster bacterium]
MQNEAIAKACCADLYQSDMAKLIMGDSLHPGGLGLTNKLGRLMGLQAGNLVADLASAQGTSAQALSRVFHCSVLGVEFGAAAVRSACNAAPEGSTAHFVQGDAESLPMRSAVFDAAVCECSMSLFINKAQAVAEVARLLRPGGKFGLSDVTIEPGSLPADLEGELGQVLCMTDALTADGYVALLEEGGFTITERLDASGEIAKILDEVEGKLAAFLALQNMSSSTSGVSTSTTSIESQLEQAPGLVTKVRKMVRAGDLGYWLFVGEKRP